MGGKNRIVVDYGDMEDLVLLCAINIESGEEMSYDELSARYYKSFPIVKRYEGINDVFVLKNMEEDNKEGFVVKYSNGFRMKVKFDSYIKLHSIVTNVSNKIIWKYLKDNLPFEDIINNVPDEFFRYVTSTKKELEDAYKEIENECFREYLKVNNTLDINVALMDLAEYKKQFANEIKNFKLKGIVFSMLEDRDYSEAIWELIKPEYRKAFITDETE